MTGLGTTGLGTTGLGTTRLGTTGSVVAVDLGATGVATVVDVPPGGSPTGPPDGPGTCSLDPVDVPGPGGVVEPAAVFAPADGTALCVGGEARRRAAGDPARYEPTPRLRVDEDDLLLGTRVVGVTEACGAVLADAVARAGPLLRGERPRTLVLTHPPAWDRGRLEVLRRAGSGLAQTLRLVPEPVAAAAHARWLRPRDAATRGPLAVLDLGATGATATVLEPTGARCADVELLAHRADDGFGGHDADELLVAHLLAGLADDPDAARVHEVAAGATLADRRHRQVLLDDVRAAKERLSEAEQAPVALPGRVVAAWLSRAELEDVLRPALRGVVGLLADTVAAAGTTPERLAGVWLTGGGARVPLLGALLHRELGVPATVAGEPRTIVARGALVVARDLDALPAPQADEPLPPSGAGREASDPDEASWPARGAWVTGAAGGLGVLAAAARATGEDLGPGAGRDAAPPGSPGAAGAPSSGPFPGVPTSGPFPVRPASEPFPVGPFPVGPFPAGGASGPRAPGSATGPLPRAGDPRTADARTTCPPARAPAPPGLDAEALRVSPRDPDDTGEILDDSWDGRWGDDDRDHGGARTDLHDDPRVAPLARVEHDARQTSPIGDEHPRRSVPVPRPPRARPARRAPATAGAVVALVVALVGLVVGLTRAGGDPATAPADVVEAWGHRFAVPAGWVRAGGDDAARRVLLRRPEAPRGVDLIAVQAGVLPRDLAADPERARARIAAQYEQARAAGDPVSGLELRATVAGRDVTRYRQRVAAGVRLDWVVLLSGGDQVSVGCRHADDGGGGATLPRACEDVVGSLDAVAE